jgi:hypothetical protein
VVLRASLGVHSHIGRNALSGRHVRMIPSKPTAYGWITESGGPIKVRHGFRLPSRPFLGWRACDKSSCHVLPTRAEMLC